MLGNLLSLAVAFRIHLTEIEIGRNHYLCWK